MSLVTSLLLPRFVPMPVGSRVRVPAPRTCGDCTLCCNLQGVNDLQPPKPSCTDCKHMNTGRALRRHGGCDIYKRRPQSCQDYKCLWLEGLGEETDRPDRIGAIFEFIPENLANPGDGTHFILVRTTREGIEETGPVARLIRYCRTEAKVPVGILGPKASRKAGPGNGWRLELLIDDGNPEEEACETSGP